MLLQKSATLEELLVATLASRPNATVRELDRRLHDSGHRYTSRGIYKELTKLEAQEIVVKTKQRYSLRLSWLTNLLSFAEKAYDTHTSSHCLAELIVAMQGKFVHRFSSLRRLDLCWIQAMMALHRLYPGKAMCLWIPHQWFHLVHDYAIKQFYGALDITGEKRYHIFGMDCYLSRLAFATLPKQGEYSFAPSPFRDHMNIYYSFIGDHLITVRIDPPTVRKIQQLFEDVRSAADLKRTDLTKVFQARVRATLCIEAAPAKTRRLRGIFEGYFGTTIV